MGKRTKRENFLGTPYKGGATTQSSGCQSILDSRTAFLDVIEASPGIRSLRKKWSIFAFVFDEKLELHRGEMEIWKWRERESETNE